MNFPFKLRVYYLCGFVLLLPVFALAQPANDNACSATSITVAESADPCKGASYNVAGATYQAVTVPQICASTGTAPDVWFKFTTTSPNVSIYFTSTKWSADTLSYIQLFYAFDCAGPFYLRDCWPITTGLHNGEPRVVNYIQPGTDYYIRLVKGVMSDNINLCVNTGTPAASSKVGINTKLPVTNFDVAGNARFRDNVGIGTATPQAKLHVVGSANVEGNINMSGTLTLGSYPVAFLNSNTLDLPATTGDKLLFDRGYNGIKAGIGYYSNPSVYGSNIYFYNWATEDQFIFGRGDPFYSGGQYFAEWMRLTGDGKLGIGTASPDAKLHVAGSIKMVDGQQAAGKVLTSDAAGLASWQNLPAQAPGYWSVLNNNIYNTNTGNVGIGTNSPGFPLNFSNTSGDKISLWGNSGAHYGFGIQGGLLQIHADGSGSDIAFGYGSSSNLTERMRIINQGEFGMSLKGRIQLQTGTQSAGLWLTNSANNANVSLIGLANDNQVGLYAPAAGWGLTMNTSTGNVGIGLNGAAAQAPLQFSNALGLTKISLFRGTYGDVGIGVYGGELRLQNDIPNGKVSMGVIETNGSYTELAKAQRNGAYAFSIMGSLWVNGTTYASDARFKKNIEPLTNSLQKILQLDGVSYQMKSEEFPGQHFDSTKQVGLIAQDVEKIVPEVVSTGPNGYKAIDYAKLVPLLIEGLKSQEKNIKAMEVLAAKQQEQIQALLKKLETISNK